MSTSPKLRAEVYPILPDCGVGDIACYGAPPPAEDGHPWRRACKCCALIGPGDILPGGSELTKSDLLNCPADRVFYCIHKEDNGESRICATWAARRKKMGLAPAVKTGEIEA
jgi:hypothetical protein